MTSPCFVKGFFKVDDRVVLQHSSSSQPADNARTDTT